MFLHKAILVLLLTVAVSADYQSTIDRGCEAIGRHFREQYGYMYECGSTLKWSGESQDCSDDVKQRVWKEFEYYYYCDGAEVVEINDDESMSAMDQLCRVNKDLWYYKIMEEPFQLESCGYVIIGGDFGRLPCRHLQEELLADLKDQLGCSA